MANPRLCSIPDCGKTLVARGLCSAHYQRIQKKGYVRPVKPCSVDGCTRQLHAQGCCVKHYKRLLKYGDPLAGSTDWGAAAAFLEAAVVHADKEQCLTWPFSVNREGGAQIRINYRLTLVARVVCERVHGKPPTPKHQAAHSCGRGHLGCVNPHHLSWKTQRENEADKIIHGTSWRHRPHHWRKLSEADVMQIRNLYASGTKQADLSRMFGVTRSGIFQIVTRRAWAYLEDHPCS